MIRQNQWLFEAPFTAEALFEFENMTREQMREFLKTTWKKNPILPRIANAQTLSGAKLSEKLKQILTQFEVLTRIKVDVVPDGEVQRLRGRGNFASLRSRPGFLQIEYSVYHNPARLLKEVIHELAFHFAGGSKAPQLNNTPFRASDLLEMMIQGNGKLPPNLTTNQQS